MQRRGSVVDSPGYAEYTVTRKAEGNNLLLRILLIGLYVFFALIYFIFFTAVIPIVMMIALLPLFVWMLVFFTWRYAALEIEYQIHSGTVSFYHIYGERSRRKKFSCKTKDLITVAPMDRTHEKDFTRAVLLHDFRGTKNTPDAYYLTFNKDGKTCAVFFEATTKTVKSFRYFNSAATVVSTSLRY
jgi:hypothetical protein